MIFHRRKRRGFSAVELVLVIAIGLAITGFSLSLMINITKRSRSTEARGRMMDRSTAAIDSLARELDYRLPGNLPGWDYSVEKYGGNSIQFLSTRRLESSGDVVLAEYRMENVSENASRAEQSLGTRLVRTERRLVDGSIISTKDITSYGPKVEANISFYYDLKDSENEEEKATAATSRPDTIKIKLRALSSLGGVAAQNLVGYWRSEMAK